MKLLRNVNGDDLARHLERHWGYVRVGQTGSHIKLRTQVPYGHTATIPAHKPLKTGTLQGIWKGIATHKGVNVAAILKNF